MVLPILIRPLGGGGAGPRLEGAIRDGRVVMDGARDLVLKALQSRVPANGEPPTQRGQA